MFDREIDGRGPGRIVGDQNHLAEAQNLYHRFQIAKLLAEAIGRSVRLVGRPKSQEVEGDNPAPALHQEGNQIIIDVQVVRKAVHQHERRPRALIVLRIERSLRARNAAFDKMYSACHSFLLRISSSD